ncbi:unnamed protein product [Linum trigynum]|uniref:Kinesin motor domain-containing protein n=1 Tax=Linum trigynum TaxID=586398 RepID=A0AAV2FZC2_9ROSI
MPFNYEAAASAIKNRFGFNDRSTSESVPSTPLLLNSAARGEFTSGKPLFAASAARRIVEWEDDAAGETSGLATQSSELGDDSSFWKDNNVQVIIRMRPLSGSEISQQGHKTCVRRENPQVISWTGPPESRYTFDLVADETVSQEQMFKVAGLPMVDNCMGGYNSCMFAYGQTGSGKTYTMLGDIEGGTRRHSVHCGMTPRVFEYLFSRIQKEKDVRKDEKLKFVCKCSFLEIYNEQILDLLDPSSNNLQIREDVKKGVYVENLKEVEVTSSRDVIQQLIEGAANRKVAATNMNHASSRSHSVFTCIIESKWESQGVTHHRFARLNLVDLAGSERQKSSGAEGERLKEATNINKSLSTLGLVIMNLVSISNGKSLHVPYRDSKLTFLLQDSLGGNSKTIIVANISPALCNSLETLGTLKFAQRAKFIKNNAIVNEDTSGDVIGMRMQIQQLKKEVSHLRSLVNDGAGSFAGIEASAVSIAGSPTAFKWEGLQGSFSPFVSDKRVSQKPDYEIALIGAIRREKDKDMEMKALKAENQAVLLLAKQREDEIQGLKMRLRFREAGVKRLESVAAGKISAETHLLQEKEEQLKEIQLLRTQVDRNQEVTRFAMENLKLKEEIRRLKSCCEEGEREIMNEQITVLQNKLLEALDWKLMHESETFFSQKEDSVKEKDDDIDLFKLSKESGSPWRLKEENEFLCMQAIQNQAEIDTLHKQLSFCLEERDKLESHANELAAQLEETRKHINEEPSVGMNDQMELKTMVDAIAAATQREAELSNENAEVRSKLEARIHENEELQSKLKALIEEKNSLIEMYERAASESKYKASDDNNMDVDSPDNTPNDSESRKAALENLEQQLSEMHEENDRLLGLYETAMREKDELRKELHTSEEAKLKLETALEKKLSDYTRILTTVEEALTEFDRVSHGVEAKQQELSSLEHRSKELQHTKSVVENKFSALRCSLSNFSSSLAYFDQREARARARFNASSSDLSQKEDGLARLQAEKTELEAATGHKAKESQLELKTKISALRSKLDEESLRRRESEKVLLAIDNIERTDGGGFGKATELLKSEEEKAKVHAELQQSIDRLNSTRKETEDSNRKLRKIDAELQGLQLEVEKSRKTAEEMKVALDKVVEEKEGVTEMIEMGKSEVERMVVEYYQGVFAVDLKEAEMRILEEEVLVEVGRMEDLRARKSAIAGEVSKHLGRNEVL